MSQKTTEPPATVRIGYKVHYKRFFVDVPVSEFTALYSDTTVTMMEIAARFGVNINGVVAASKRLDLRPRYFHQRYIPAYTKIDKERLRELIEVHGLSFQKAADEFGVQRHHIARAVTEFGIKTRRETRQDCVECVECGRCRLFSNCRSIVHSLYLLPCEAALAVDPAAGDIDTDTTPSLSYGAMPFCDLMR